MPADGKWDAHLQVGTTASCSDSGDVSILRFGGL